MCVCGLIVIIDHIPPLASPGAMFCFVFFTLPPFASLPPGGGVIRAALGSRRMCRVSTERKHVFGEQQEEAVCF